MPEPTLGVICCVRLRAEVEAVMARLGSPAEVLSFPSVCHLGHRAHRGHVPGLDLALQRFDRVIGICLKCHVPAPGWVPSERFALVEANSNAALFLGADAEDRALSEGALVALPAWVADWRQIVEREWRFSPESAREFFQASARCLLILETGVVPVDPAEVDALVAFTGLPAEFQYVGTSHLEAVTARVLDRMAADRARAEQERAIGRSRARAAEIGILLDFVSSAGDLLDEEALKSRLIDLCQVLFAPAEVVWTPPSPESPRRRVRALAEADGSGGIRVELAHGGRELGLLLLRSVAFPESTPRYLELASALADVTSMALHAARMFGEGEALRADLGRRVQELDFFSSVVAHDLMQPIQVCTGYNDLLREAEEVAASPTARRYLALQAASLARMGTLVHELLTLSRIGRQDLTLEDVALDELFAELAHDLGPTLAERGAVLDVGPLPVVLGTRRWLSEAFANLIQNAVRYNDNEHPVVRVAAGGTAPPELGLRTAVIEITDNGRGIDPDDQQRIFEAFQRGRNTRGVQGSGVGLAIVKKAVEQGQGRVWVRSVPGEGSTFFLALPLAEGGSEG